MKWRFAKTLRLQLLLGGCLLVTLLVVWTNNSYKATKQTTLLRFKGAAPPATPPIVVWWTPLLKNYHKTRQCGFHSCTFSVRRDLQAKAKAFLYYGSDLDKLDFPLPRLPNQLWALLHEESPKNIAYMSHEAVLRHFNYTSTFSRHSDMPLTTQYLRDLQQLTSSQYLVPIGEKTRLRQREQLAPIVYLQSICDTLSGRDEWVTQLMQHIDVDAYGQCLQNKQLPKHLTVDYLQTLNSPELYRFLARYKFIIAYENGICNDYISEKFWRPLVIGSVPIYFGAPNIKDWQPNNKSIIHISDFASPQALAAHIKYLDSNDVAYNSYLDHKYSQLHAVSNQLLMDTMLERSGSDVDNMFDHFECYVCQQVHEALHSTVQSGAPPRQATRSHYDCPEPLVYPELPLEALQRLRDSDWTSIAAVGKCQAHILDRLLRRNANFTKQEFDDLLNQDIRTNKCQF